MSALVTFDRVSVVFGGRVRALDASALPHATRTSVEVVRSAYATALEGFALPYGDVAVGSWRKTPYVVTICHGRRDNERS